MSDYKTSMRFLYKSIMGANLWAFQLWKFLQQDWCTIKNLHKDLHAEAQTLSCCTSWQPWSRDSCSVCFAFSQFSGSTFASHPLNNLWGFCTHMYLTLRRKNMCWINSIEYKSKMLCWTYYIRVCDKICTWAGLPLVTGVWTAGLLHCALLRYTGPEFGPVQTACVSFAWPIIHKV